MAFHQLNVVLVLLFALQAFAGVLRGKPSELVKPYKRAPLQDLVTWDEHSLFVHGERVLFYSGEYHPFRLPVPGLWLDVFQKIKSLGYNGVSFYTDWALLEGQPGVFRADGIFALEPFFEAASAAGIYLLARPGPYINAEVSGGGYPGWLQRINGQLRVNDTAYLNATSLYAQSIGQIIAKAQITNGGPVILAQPENEYSQAAKGVTPFPNHDYFHDVEEQLRDAGIVVPLISNDAAPHGYFGENTGLGGVGEGLDIYGHDSYPLGFDCANPYTWPDGSLPLNFRTLHEEQSPGTPYSLIEFQGGSFDPWGGLGFAQCADLLNYEFERVFYKNDFSFGVTIFNIYMTYGGTNWGNLGHPGGYTSYDYGAVITEDRLVTREKYSEAKLEANFLMASPAYLIAQPSNNTNANGSYTDSAALAVTRLSANTTNFFVVRHAAYNTLNATTYTLTVPTTQGNITIPQLGGTLTLSGRDSKIHVTDYDVGGTNLLYSSAEIFTWKTSASKTVLVVYGGPQEQHELAIVSTEAAQQLEGAGAQIIAKDGSTIISFQTSNERRIVQLGTLFVYILDRNTAYNYWTLPITSSAPAQYGSTSSNSSTLVASAEYLLRNATISDDALLITGDLNCTTTLEIISGAPDKLQTLKFNGQSVAFKQDSSGVVTAQLEYKKPTYSLPSLADLDWKYLDSLPEIQTSYDDGAWTAADLASTPNIANNLSTPTSLFSSDYGYHTGTLLYRGHFVANGNESSLFIETQGGYAYGHSIWLNGTFVGSWAGIDADANANTTYSIPSLQSGSPYVFTIVIDNMGLNENGAAGDSGMKNPRGILKYQLAGHQQSDVSWKLTGNLGGEEYRDLTRGPLNEGGMYAERQGFHLPAAPSSSWALSKPTDGISQAGIGFYYTSFDLSLPQGYDIPLSFVFANATSNSTAESNYRLQLFVNGYQFGKYVHQIGPQDSFPVPDGILNSRGTNYVALTIWAQDAAGAKVDGIELVSSAEIQTGYGDVVAAPQPAYSARSGSY